jgi:hypothetical protein
MLNIRTIRGIVASENPLGMFKTWRLRSFVGKFDGATRDQLYVTVDYFSSTRRKHFNEASDGSTTRLVVTPIESEFDSGCSRNAFAYGCHYSEDIGIEFTELPGTSPGLWVCADISLATHRLI